MASAAKRRAVRKKTAVAKRARRRDRNPLYDPGQQLSGNALATAAGQLTDLQFKPQEQALDEQSKTATTQGTALADRSRAYYAGVAKEAAAAVANQQAIRDRLSTGLSAIGDQAQARVGQAQTDAATASSADSALRGQGLSGGGAEKTAAELAAQKASAANAAGQYQAAGALQSGNYAGLQAGIQGSSALKGGEAQTSLLNRLAGIQAGIGQKRADLSSQRGAAKEKNILDLRQQGFENAVTVQGLGIDKAKISSAAQTAAAGQAEADKKQKSVDKHNAALERIAQQNADTTSGRLLTAQQQDAYKRKHHLGPYKPAAAPKKTKQPAAVRTAKIKGRTQIGQARIAFTRSGGDYNKYIQNAPKDFPVPVLHAGFELVKQGFIGPHTVKDLKAIGITVPSSWTKDPHSPVSIGVGRGGRGTATAG